MPDRYTGMWSSGLATLEPVTLAVIGTLPNVSEPEDSGVKTFETAQVFRGSDTLAITYSLVSPPAGVSVNSATGRVAIDTASAAVQAGTEVTVRAETAGMSVEVTFSLTITEVTSDYAVEGIDPVLNFDVVDGVYEANGQTFADATALWSPSISGKRTVINASGNLVDVPANTLALEYDPSDNSLLGLPLRQALAGHLDYPEIAVDSNGWSGNSSTLTSAGLNAFGRFTGVVVPSQGAVWNGARKNGCNMVSGDIIPVLCVYKAGTSGEIMCKIRANGVSSGVSGVPGSIGVYEDDAGAVGNIREIDYGNGYRAVSFEIDSTETDSDARMDVGPHSATSGENVTVLYAQSYDDQGVPWGIMPGEGSVQSRDADVLTKLLSQIVAGPHEEHTLYMEFIRPDYLLNAGESLIAGLANSDQSDLAAAKVSEASVIVDVDDDGGNILNAPHGSVTGDSIVKVAMRIKGGLHGISVDTAEPKQHLGALPNGLDRLVVGGGSGIYLRRLRVYPFGASQASLAGLTGATPVVEATPVNTVDPVASGTGVESTDVVLSDYGTWTGGNLLFRSRPVVNGAPVGEFGDDVTSYTAGTAGDTIAFDVEASNGEGTTVARSNAVTVITAPSQPAVAALKAYSARAGRDRSELAGMRFRDFDFSGGLDNARIEYQDNLNSSGAGSFDYGTDAGGDDNWTFIIPRVAGFVQNQSNPSQKFSRAKTAFLGMFAPLSGVAVGGDRFRSSKSDVLAMHLGIYGGDMGKDDDALYMRNSGESIERILFQNCSFFGGNDEVIAVDSQPSSSAPGGVYNIRYVSFVDCEMGLPIDNPGSDERPHIFGPYCLDGSRGIEFARNVIGGFRARVISVESGGGAAMFSNLVLYDASELMPYPAPFCFLEEKSKSMSPTSRFETYFAGAWNLLISPSYDWSSRNDIRWSTFMGWGNHREHQSHGGSGFPRTDSGMTNSGEKLYSHRDGNWCQEDWGDTPYDDYPTDPKPSLSTWVNETDPSYCYNHKGWDTPALVASHAMTHSGKFPSARDPLQEIFRTNCTTRTFNTLSSLPSYSMPTQSTPDTLIQAVSDPFRQEEQNGVTLPRVMWQARDKHIELNGIDPMEEAA